MCSLAYFGPESALYPSASFASFNQVSASPLGIKYLAEGDGSYFDHMLFQRAMSDFARQGGGELLLLPAMAPNGVPLAYAWNDTVEIPSGVRVRGLGGSVRIKAWPGLAAPLFAFEDNGSDYSLDGVILDTSLNVDVVGSEGVRIGANARRVGLSLGYGGPSRNPVVLMGSVWGLRVGDREGLVQPQWMGAHARAWLFRDAVITGGALDHLHSATAGFSEECVGMDVDVSRAGAPDAVNVSNLDTLGRQTHSTTVLSYVSPTEVILADPALNAVDGEQGTVGVDDTTVLLAAGTLSAASHSPVDLGVANYWGRIVLPSGTSLRGRGIWDTTIRARNLENTVSSTLATDIEVADLTAEGFGPDGGPTGGTFKGCLLVSQVQRASLRNLRLRFGTGGLLVTNGADRLELPTRYITLDNLSASSITNSNGTSNAGGGGGGVAFWFFNGVEHVEGTNVFCENIARHGFYLDAGTSTGAQSISPVAHGYLKDFSIANVAVVRAGHPDVDGVGGLAFGVGLAGAKRIHIGAVSVLSSTACTNADGLAIAGDQNGEISSDNTLGQVTLTDIVSQAVVIQGRRNAIGDLKILGFNHLGGSSYSRPIVFNNYSGATRGVYPAEEEAPDTTDNVIHHATVVGNDGDVDAAIHDYTVVFSGGTMVPDGPYSSRTINDGSMTAGSKLLDSAGSQFVVTQVLGAQSDAFQAVVVHGAGLHGGDLVAMITATAPFTTAQVTLDSAAATTVTGATVDIYTRGKARNQGAMTAGSHLVTTDTDFFVAEDAHRHIFVQDAAAPVGGSPAYLISEILRVDTPRQALLADAAAHTIGIATPSLIVYPMRRLRTLRNRVLSLNTRTPSQGRSSSSVTAARYAGGITNSTTLLQVTGYTFTDADIGAGVQLVKLDGTPVLFAGSVASATIVSRAGQDITLSLAALETASDLIVSLSNVSVYAPSIGADANGVGPAVYTTVPNIQVAEYGGLGDQYPRLQLMSDRIKLGSGSLPADWSIVHTGVGGARIDGDLSVTGVLTPTGGLASTYTLVPYTVVDGPTPYVLPITGSATFGFAGQGGGHPLSIIAAALALPPLGTAGGGIRLFVFSGSAHAHTITTPPSNLVEGGTFGSVLTFGGATGDYVELMSTGSAYWVVAGKRNVTLS